MINNEPKNILLVQLFSNGDCLYATTIARQIKQDYPGCKLTWAIASFCKDIIVIAIESTIMNAQFLHPIHLNT